MLGPQNTLPEAATRTRSGGVHLGRIMPAGSSSLFKEWLVLIVTVALTKPQSRDIQEEPLTPQWPGRGWGKEV